MNRVGKLLVIMGLTVVLLFAVAAMAEADEHEAKAALALAQAEESLKLGRANAEELERLRVEMVTLKTQVEMTTKALEKIGCPCGETCPCGPDCPCPGCPHRKQGAATGGHWNCGPGGCQWIPLRGESAAGSAAPTRSPPKQPGTWHWQIGADGRYTWISYDATQHSRPVSSPVYSTGVASVGVGYSVPSYSYAAPVYSSGGSCAGGMCGGFSGGYSMPVYGGYSGGGYSYGGGCASGNCR